MNDKGSKTSSVGEIIGPLSITNKAWPPATQLVTRLLGRDESNRVYAVGTKGHTRDYYLTRILADIDLDGDRSADIDPAFGENGFVHLSAGNGLIIASALQIIDITGAHLTVSVEVVGESDYVFQTALFRVLVDGQADPSFGVNGVALFAELPAPASLSVPATAAHPRVEPWKRDEGQARQAPREDTTDVPGTHAKVLANGQILLVAHKRGHRRERLSYLIKVNENGSLDASFADGVGYLRLTFGASTINALYKMSADTRARSVVVSESADGTYCLVARLSAEGRLDPGFGGSGILRISSPAGAMHQPLMSIDEHDRVVICVRFSPDGPGWGGAYLFRLEEDGSTDPTFNNGNPVEFMPTPPVDLYTADTLALDEQHRIILRGIYNDAGAGLRTVVLVSRFTAQGLDTDFGDAGSVSLPGFGFSGGLTAQAGRAVVVSDATYLWKLQT